jgi:hypothetical protein
MNQKEIEAVRNHISNIPAIGAMYAPVLLEWLEVALKERDAAVAKAEQYENDWREAKNEFGTATSKLRERLRAAEDLYKKSMDRIHEAAGIKRDGLVAILAWIEEMHESTRVACENTPTRGCECLGCGYAREQAR